MKDTKNLSQAQQDALLSILKTRFENNRIRHENLEWINIESKLKANPEKLWSLNEMENTGGEPDVVAYDDTTGEYLFFDCAPESPNGRRSFCYDAEALASRKEHKPKNNVIDSAKSMGIELLSEEQYKMLQQFGKFDTKTSSWLRTPSEIRKLGGAIFGDFRYGNVFVYHNGAESYYASRAFRGSLSV